MRDFYFETILCEKCCQDPRKGQVVFNYQYRCHMANLSCQAQKKISPDPAGLISSRDEVIIQSLCRLCPTSLSFSDRHSSAQLRSCLILSTYKPHGSPSLCSHCQQELFLPRREVLPS